MRNLAILCVLALASPATALDSTDLQAAIDRATGDRTQGNGRVIVPAGVHVLTRPLTIRQGIAFGGPINPGTTPGYPATLVWAGDGDLLTINGEGKDGAPYAGTGGTIENLLIVRRGRSGGTAVRVTAIDDAHRPGELEIRNVVIYGERPAAWDRGIVVDGTRCTTVNASGVRRVRLHDVRVGDCTDSHFLFWGAVSLHATGCQADPGHAATRATVRFVAPCHDCSWDGVVNGDLYAAGRHTSVRGKVSRLYVEAGTIGTADVSSEQPAVNRSAKFLARVALP